MLGSALGLLLVTAAAILGGAQYLSPARILAESEAAQIALGLRAPRAVMALTVGAGLALAGMIYQALFRNQLASPFSLGISSGAALGATAAVWWGGSLSTATTSGAVLGALAAVGSILTLSRLQARSPQALRSNGEGIILIGIVLSFFCSSVLTLLQYLSDATQLFRITRWMLGGIPTPQWGELAVGAALVLLLAGWVWRNQRGLDLIWFGDDLAAVKGVEVRPLYRSAFLLTSLVIGWIVAQCGVIGFVGIVVPALARTAAGLSHRTTAPLAALWGAILVVLCDLLGRAVIPPFEVPVGVFTALLGGPVFIWFLLRYPKDGS
jgi:iron complex transport system permease protein